MFDLDPEQVNNIINAIYKELRNEIGHTAMNIEITEFDASVVYQNAKNI